MGSSSWGVIRRRGDPHEDYRRLARAIAEEPLPAALVDLEAFDANAAAVLARVAGAGVTLRLATKSLRVPALLRRVMALGGERVRGLMTFSARETAWLAEAGFDDLLLAYPVARPEDARALAAAAAHGASVVAMVDEPAHVELLAGVAREAGGRLAVGVDVDVSLRLFGGRVHLGVRRSPVRDPAAALALARRARHAGLEVRALLAYEAQVAGLPDRTPGSRLLDPARRLVKRRSSALAAARRRAVVAALRGDGFAVEIVNGGGTGSLAATAHDGSCTEVTAGSGFFAPHLFDRYDGLGLRPAALFAIPVTRASDPGWITCSFGGYPASGAAGADRLPIVHLPWGLEAEPLEGFGEVQTPLRVAAGAAPPQLGAPVFCRHAKAGELAERFGDVLLVRGEQVVWRAPTYRGLGPTFG